MEEISISKFKATCLAVLAKVQKTGQPVLVTRFGHPIARIEPPAPKRIKLGGMIGKDTHIWLWTLLEPHKLSSEVSQVMLLQIATVTSLP